MDGRLSTSECVWRIPFWWSSLLESRDELLLNSLWCRTQIHHTHGAGVQYVLFVVYHPSSAGWRSAEGRPHARADTREGSADFLFVSKADCACRTLPRLRLPSKPMDDYQSYSICYLTRTNNNRWQTKRKHNTRKQSFNKTAINHCW